MYLFNYLLGTYFAVHHKEYIAQHADSFDVFIYQEDDIILTPSNILAYLRESHFLHEASLNSTSKGAVFDRGQVQNYPIEESYMAGFFRYSKKAHHSDSAVSHTHLLSHTYIHTYIVGGIVIII